MAFQQPTLPPITRQSAAPPIEEYNSTPKPQIVQPLDDSREWILFPRAESATYTNTASTERTPRTAGLSRLSDFGSLNTAARSGQDDIAACQATPGSEPEEEDLDSLDDGLHAFQESSMQQRFGYLNQGGSILPRHDGLGTFPASGSGVQDQIWHFEQHNPRKRSFTGHQRRRSSVQRRLDAVEQDDATKVEDEKREMIERWRLEHSRVLLDEIEKQTRRRQSTTKSPALNVHITNASSTDRLLEHDGGHPPGSTSKATSLPVEDSESFLQRITRRVIRDFIGLDDATLSVIFGETLPSEEKQASLPRPTSSESPRFERQDKQIPWESRLLNRIARELGILLDHLSDHPATVGTLPVFNPLNSDYAGIPVTQPTSSRTHPRRSILKDSSIMSPSFDFVAPRQRGGPSSPLAAAAEAAESQHASSWGIEENSTRAAHQQLDRDYWEQPADLKTVVRFLHNRFAASRRPASSTKTTTPLNIATTSTPDSLRRAAVIRQYHPLVSRNASQWEQRHGRRSWLHSRNGYTGSSCGSQSLQRTRRGATTSIGSSSRNFWDIGGSATGSMVGGLGGWGEV